MPCWGSGQPQSAATAAAGTLRAAIDRGYGPSGYSRHLGGRPDSVDLGVAFLLPPFAAASGESPDAAMLAAWRRSATLMARPAGGLAPGGSWRRDGVSWTNITATSAVVAAFVGDREDAYAGLAWLAAHRTEAGSLPEKVLANGQPASVAPLAWTAAAVADRGRPAGVS